MLGQRQGETGHGPADTSQRLDVPQAARPLRLIWSYAVAIALVHGLALLAFSPWFFSWAGVALALLGLYVFGTLGINLCFHRLLTHRGLVLPKGLERAFAILGVCCVQDTPARWVAIHRRHHARADEQPDPHSPLAGFLWAHMGWIVFRNSELTREALVSRYAKDIMRDPVYAALEQRLRWVWVVLASWLVFFVAGAAIELALGGSMSQALQFGSSLLVWGAFVRTVLVWHITWSVNSVAHLWGYRTYETGEGSRNNLIVGFISNGEGWHNNHHADPRAARHGHRWWELDVTWLTVRLLAALGLARKVVAPSVGRPRR
ncbi:acyl-CoA desaturase [Vineibacter terrae]|uniref:acyl-CoA desaturase n=1 Tax=Vineibacter terrae TaxID=2586908 RepID=UPI002E34B96C|nr:fatty acid desaturase [Vineibacter terrae]HEX2891292.1 fatty acid desaturase [Vineibacter terrae]